MVKKTEESTGEALTCGLVMPISAIDGCGAEHWVEVKNIISDAIADIDGLKFTAKLVSEQDDVGVIQKRIVQNVYSSDIVVCDVSCKNANVMFELGMRLAFDKPTILIKDDVTDFTFDAGVIEHLVYPRDLRFSRIVTFKKLLAEKVLATYRASIDDPNHSTFLKNFGSFKVASVNETLGTPDQVMIDMIQDLSREVARISRRLPSYKDISVSQGSPAGAPQEFVRDVIAGVMAYKKKFPLASFEAVADDPEFYDFLASYVIPNTKFSSFDTFKRSTAEVIKMNPHLLG